MTQSQLLTIADVKYDYEALCKLAKTGPLIDVEIDKFHNAQSLHDCKLHVNFGEGGRKDDEVPVVYSYNGLYLILFGKNKIDQDIAEGKKKVSARLVSKHLLKKAEYFSKEQIDNAIRENNRPRREEMNRDSYQPRRFYQNNSEAGGRRY